MKYRALILSFWILSPPLLAGGKMVFGEVERLPDKWWKQPEIVWSYWDPETYYLWGANKHNYNKKHGHQHLSGSGMASYYGPTRGRGHPHYVGVITTSLSHKINDRIFDELESKLKSGATIVVPAFQGRCALGTGVAFKRYGQISDWYRSQRRLYEAFLRFSRAADEVYFSEGVFWPDCGLTRRRESSVNLPIRSVEDLEELLIYLDAAVRITSH